MAIAAISGPLLDVYQQFDADTIGSQGMSEATRAILVAFVLLTFAGIGWAMVDRAPLVGSAGERRLGDGAGGRSRSDLSRRRSRLLGRARQPA